LVGIFRKVLGHGLEKSMFFFLSYKNVQFSNGLFRAKMVV
jgi:hypothetical protein